MEGSYIRSFYYLVTQGFVDWLWRTYQKAIQSDSAKSLVVTLALMLFFSPIGFLDFYIKNFEAHIVEEMITENQNSGQAILSITVDELKQAVNFHSWELKVYGMYNPVYIAFLFIILMYCPVCLWLMVWVYKNPDF